MDIRKIKKLIEIFTSANLSELEVTSGEDSVKISKNKKLDKLTNAPSQEFFHSSPENLPTESPKEEKGYELKSPMVGTYYAAPSPDAKPFIQIGSRVKKGLSLIHN